MQSFFVTIKKQRRNDMPGYILHLAAAKIATETCAKLKGFEEAFLLGSLMPDTVKEKSGSHFRNPIYHGNMIEYPDMELFLQKYENLLQDKSCLGYCFHLFTDYKYFHVYLPSIIELRDAEGKPAEKRCDVVWVYHKRRKEQIPRDLFFSDAYLYGDYTKLNRFLVERYQLPISLPVSVENPGIDEVDYENVKEVFGQLQGYMELSESQVQDLKVLELEDLITFLEHTVEEFIKEYLEKNG